MEQTQKFENPRHAILKELAQAHDERESAGAKGVGEAVEFEPAPSDEPQKEAAQTASAEAEKPAENAAPLQDEQSKDQPRAADGKFATAEPKPEMVSVKIDDEVIQVPKADVDAAGSVQIYQIERAAAKRLQKINEQSRALAQKLSEAEAFISQQRQQPQQQPSAQQHSDPNQDQVLKELTDQLNFGDDTQRTAAVKKILEMAKQPSQDVDAKVMAAINWTRFNDSERQFVERAKDLLFNDKGEIKLSIVDAAKSRVDRVRQYIAQTGQFPPNPDEFFKNLEMEFRQEFGKPAVTSDLSSRVEKKAEIVEPKTAAGRVPAPAEKKPLTVSEQIDQIRKGRGQKALYH